MVIGVINQLSYRLRAPNGLVVIWFLIWLVVDLPLWKIWKSVGMMKFPIYGKKHVPNHQPVSTQCIHIQIREGTRNMFVPPWQDLVRSFQGITKAPNKLLQQELIVRIISPDNQIRRNVDVFIIVRVCKSSGTVGIPTWIAVGSLVA